MEKREANEKSKRSQLHDSGNQKKPKYAKPTLTRAESLIKWVDASCVSPSP